MEKSRLFGISKSKMNRVLTALLFFLPFLAPAQKTVITDSSQPGYRTLIAGKEYGAGRTHQWLWGEDFRKEWTTPVKIPVLDLDSAFGGLTPVKTGGGRQTKSLRLNDPQGRQYVLRTVDK